MCASFKTRSDKWKLTLVSTRKSEKNVQDFLDSLEDESFLYNNFIGGDEGIDDDHNYTDLVAENTENDPNLDSNVPPDDAVDPDEGGARLCKFKLKNLEKMNLEK